MTCKVRFSEHFDITITRRDDWFDPVLIVDTLLFIDPFLIFAYKRRPFVDSRRDVDEFYDYVRDKVLTSTPHSLAVAEDALCCPEVAALCLGYTEEGIMGRGIGRGLARRIIERIARGTPHTYGLFSILPLVPYIAHDRISDTAARLFRPRLIKYTQDVCRRHGVPMSQFFFERGFYSFEDEEWKPLHPELPLNPFNDKPILLIPRRYLYPSLGVELYDFWVYCCIHHLALVCRVFRSSIRRRPTRTQLIKFASAHPDVWTRYLAFKVKNLPKPYSFPRDPMGVVRWYDKTGEYCKRNARTFKSNTKLRLGQAIDGMIQMFLDYILNHRGWKLLYSGAGGPLTEKTASLLLMGLMMHCCAANEIEISRPANIGRRTAEFTSPTGQRLRALLLFKFARNTAFWKGLKRQPDRLLRQDGADIIRLIVIEYSNPDLRRYRQIDQTVRALEGRTGYDINAVEVDGRSPRKRSASP